MDKIKGKRNKKINMDIYKELREHIQDKYAQYMLDDLGS
jgi:hypothetical protein